MLLPIGLKTKMQKTLIADLIIRVSRSFTAVEFFHNCSLKHVGFKRATAVQQCEFCVGKFYYSSSIDFGE